MLWNIIQKFQEDFESSDENKVQQLGRYAYEYTYIYKYIYVQLELLIPFPDIFRDHVGESYYVIWFYNPENIVNSLRPSDVHMRL